MHILQGCNFRCDNDDVETMTSDCWRCGDDGLPCEACRERDDLTAEIDFLRNGITSVIEAADHRHYYSTSDEWWLLRLEKLLRGRHGDQSKS